VFFGSVDCKGVSGERTSKAVELRGLRSALQVEGSGPDGGDDFLVAHDFYSAEVALVGPGGISGAGWRALVRWVALSIMSFQVS
jgi:hypothetical protein